MDEPKTCSVEHCIAQLTRLRLAVRSDRRQTAAEMMAQNQRYAEDLCRFPPQVVRDVCNGWGENGRGWPDLPVLLELARAHAHLDEATKPKPKQIGAGLELELMSEAILMMRPDLESQAREAMKEDPEQLRRFFTAYGQRWRDRYAPIADTLTVRRAKLGRHEAEVVFDLEDWARREFDLPAPPLTGPVAGSPFARREGVL